jgi:RNA-directed DNA polymerase
MTAQIEAGAASHPQGLDWHTIDWYKVHQNVRRLQARIVKATQQGKWGKVKALQRLLTHSFSGKALAVRRVTENHGKDTPGVDGAIWNTPKKKAQAVYSLNPRGYQPLPLRRVHIPKSNSKKLRPLGIPAMRCRAFQVLYLLALDPIAETTGDPNSYGFRKNRAVADAIAACYNVLARRFEAHWILEGDLKSCFDTISHDWLLANIPMDKTILRKWLKAGFIEKKVLHPTEAGSPQGGPISPVLANLTLDGLEAKLRQHFPFARDNGTGGYKLKYKVKLVRFADDFIITGNSKELLENEVKPLVEQFMGERGLILSEEKTRITHIDEGFDFLGQNIRKYKGKLIIKPAKKNRANFLRKIRELIKTNQQIAAGKLIVQLNPRIRGWANFHQHVVSSEIFKQVDRAVFQTLWRWVKRRHPGKGGKWLRKRYFKTVGNRNWVFFGSIIEKNGQHREVQLFSAASVPIKRHIKVQEQANPYDPKWEVYFERRLDVKMESELRGKRRLLYLWKAQKGICPNCNQKITKLTGWHSHHKVWKVYGGGEGLANRVLLHPNCHQQIHTSRDNSVGKPGSSDM